MMKPARQNQTATRRLLYGRTNSFQVRESLDRNKLKTASLKFRVNSDNSKKEVVFTDRKSVEASKAVPSVTAMNFKAFMDRNEKQTKEKIMEIRQAVAKSRERTKTANSKAPAYRRQNTEKNTMRNTFTYLPKFSSKEEVKKPLVRLNSTSESLLKNEFACNKGVLEDYQMKGEIGKGAYAVVKLAVHKATRSKVAIKVYEKFKLRDPLKKNAVKREIQVLKRIKHENVIGLQEVIENGKNIFLVIDYFQGMSLLNFIKSKPGKRIKQSDLNVIFAQLGSAMHYLHSNGICHRDIKLENVLINREMQIKIIDFGFGCFNPSKKKSAFFCGTPSYMPPEIVGKREYLAYSADIWSLGVLFYVLSVGKFPFKATNEKELYKKIKMGDYVIPEHVPKQIRSVIAKSLLVNPSKRLSVQDVSL